MLRWNHSQRGLISPAEFVPLAEETGLIVPIGSWVLTEACARLSEWQQQSKSSQTLTVSVNLSAKQVSQPDLLDQIGAALRASKLPAKCLKLEITESVVMENAETATNMFESLRP